MPSLTDLPMGVLLDLLGIFVFGLSGATLAVRRKLDIFGVAVLAIAAGLAGGMVRDVFLGVAPPAAFQDPRYIMAALASALCGFFAHPLIERLNKPVLALDALGLGLFAVSGARKALDYGLEPLSAVILGIITAVGGGVVRDILVTETPRVLREEVYALAALVGAGIMVGGRALELPDVVTAIVGVLVTLVIRLVSVWRGWRAPRAPGS